MIAMNVGPYYSIRPGAEHVLHDDSRCTKGRQIPPDELRYGRRRGYRRCSQCARIAWALKTMY